MRSRVSILAGIVGLLLLSSSALAHHGAASLYDVNKETTLKVTITEFIWTNPHVEVGIASVENKSARWLLELGSPPNIANRGWTSKSLKVGDVVTVTFNPGLRGTRIGKLSRWSCRTARNCWHEGAAPPHRDGGIAGGSRGRLCRGKCAPSAGRLRRGFGAQGSAPGHFGYLGSPGRPGRLVAASGGGLPAHTVGRRKDEVGEADILDQ